MSELRIRGAREHNLRGKVSVGVEVVAATRVEKTTDSRESGETNAHQPYSNDAEKTSTTKEKEKEWKIELSDGRVVRARAAHRLQGEDAGRGRQDVRARDAVRVRAVDERTRACDARARRDARETVAEDGARDARTSTWARKRNDGARD